MGYQPTNIAAAITNLNHQWFLPAIQREFIWKPEQIISLFDSILRGYPISSFLFWILKKENRDKWDTYKFIENAKQGGVRNDPANVDGVQQLSIVLDGQQRLTSMLVGLKGTYTIKLKYRRWDDPKAWVKQKLYLDLLKDPKDAIENGSEEGIYYNIAFLKTHPKPDNKHYWFRLGRILDFDSEDEFYEFRDQCVEELPDEVTKKQISIFQRNLERLYRAIWKDEVIAYYTERDQDYDRVLDIFVRANEGGTKLTKSDLLLSMVTSQWGKINAREEIYNFVDYLNNQLTRKNDFSKDFIMKTCLVVTDLPVAYKVQNFNIQNLTKIQQNWEDIKNAISKSIDLVNYFGIDRDNLTSANALIPIIYYFFKKPKLNIRGSTPFEVKTATNIRKWVTTALLNGAFGGSSDNLLRDIRDILSQNFKPNDNFPLHGINETIAKSGRKANFDEYTFDDIRMLTYGRQLTFLALTLLYDENGWGTITHHQDHIFPRSLFSFKNLRAAGFSKDKIVRFHSLKDRFGNLELLLPKDNEEKNAQPFESWILSRDESFKKRHLIPSNSKMYKLENFEVFLKARETMIFQRLSRLFKT